LQSILLLFVSSDQQSKWSFIPLLILPPSFTHSFWSYGSRICISTRARFPHHFHCISSRHSISISGSGLLLEIWVQNQYKSFYFRFIHFIKSNEIKSHEIRSRENIFQSPYCAVMILSCGYNHWDLKPINRPSLQQ